MHVLVLILPLLNSLICGFLGFFLGSLGCAISSIFFLGVTCLVSWYLFYSCVLLGEGYSIFLLPWIHSGCLNCDWALLIDPLSATMLIVVTTVSFFVHIYSSEYMGADPHTPRFFCYISLFTFFMVSLVSADNFLQLFFGWEGVGVCSYLLISFWYTRLRATKAALKAVLVNRVADVFIVLALGLGFSLFNSLNFHVVFSLTSLLVVEHPNLISCFCILLFLGAMGKSAQLGLHTWLPDAMEGPTPVSALIHAATMVTAGVFLVIRCSSVFEYSGVALHIVSIIGALTAFIAATIALVQHDIKKIIAYSTCSQLGYMFFSCGLSNYATGLFHLFNHAFFKALLFLSAGSIIHGMGDEQDMRRLGGAATLMPATYSCVLLGSLSLGGFPFLSGFYSKDFILETAIGAYTIEGMFAYWLGSITAFLTAFYSFRLLYVAFIQESSAPKPIAAATHEPGLPMLFPMGALSVGSIFSGFFFKDLFIGLGTPAWGVSIFVSPTHAYEFGAEFAPYVFKAVPLIFSLLGIGLVLVFYGRMGLFISRLWLSIPLVLSLLGKKWYFDSFYNRIFVLPSLLGGYSIFFKLLDKGLIELLGPTGAVSVVTWLSSRIKSLQSGFIHSYVTLLVLGLVILFFIP